jgi:hypothetical protein
MADENLSEWGSNGWVKIETIRATIDAYGRGLITLPPIPEKTRDDYIRHVVRNSVPQPRARRPNARVMPVLGG